MTDQAELLVLRHQVHVLERQVKVVRWRQADRLVLAAHASTIVATDSFSVDTVFLKRLYILFFIHLESRRIIFYRLH